MKHTAARYVLKWPVILLIGMITLGARADDDSDGPARFHDVGSWRGTLVARARPNSDTIKLFEQQLANAGKGAEWSFNYSAYCTVTFLLDKYESDPSVWTGRVTGSTYTADYRNFIHHPDNYANSQTWWKGYSDNEWTFTAGGVLDFGDDPKVELQFHRQRGWSVDMPFGRVKTVTQKRWYKYVPPLAEQSDSHDKTIDDSMTILEADKGTASGMGDTGTFPYPKKGLILEGRNVPKKGRFPFNGSVGFSPDVIWDYTIYLEPASTDELSLEIEIPADYAKWRPETTPDASAGSELAVTARLVTASGKKPETRVQQFIWELVGTSTEPGVAMNFPVEAKDDRFDLELAATGEMFVLLEKNQRMERAVREGFTDSVKVVPYDWGGWSTLQVTAILADGRRVVGKLKGEKETGLRIPKRAIDSKIADAWKQETGKSGADNLDDENDPVGDGSKGDGLTLYQEYRGFYQNSKHFGGAPKTKDFFVYLKDAGIASPGVAKFKSLTKLNVHWEFTEKEFASSRVMNLNRRQGAHLVDQHGVLIRIDQNRQDSCAAIGGPGTPARISSIDLMANIATKDASWIKSTVAHELGHCVNLYHHGETDEFVFWGSADGKIYELKSGGAISEIAVINEAYGDLTAAVIGLIQASGNNRIGLQLGRDNGQHSGFENCVMRYDNAQAYVFRAQPNVRICAEELVGHALCVSAAGTEVNKPGRVPQDRYAGAAAGRGDCLHQIHVSDVATPPSRVTKP